MEVVKFAQAFFIMSDIMMCASARKQSFLQPIFRHS
jgi:hypothetical protein